MGLIIVILLVLLLAGSVPVWPYSQNYGYAPAGGLGLVLVVLLLLILLGHVPWGW